MKIQPHDIRYMVITKKTIITKDGVKELPHILSKDHTRHDDAIAARPANISSKVAGYIRADRCVRLAPPVSVPYFAPNHRAATTPTTGDALELFSELDTPGAFGLD